MQAYMREFMQEYMQEYIRESEAKRRWSHICRCWKGQIQSNLGIYTFCGFEAFRDPCRSEATIIQDFSKLKRAISVNFVFASRKGVCIYSCFPRGRVPCSSSFFFFFLRAEKKNQRKSTFLELFENTVFFVLPPYGNCRLGVSLFGVRGRAGRWKSSPPELKRGTVVNFHKISTQKSTNICIFGGV